LSYEKDAILLNGTDVRIWEDTIHVIGHAHMDMNWLWIWAETMKMCNDNLRH